MRSIARCGEGGGSWCLFFVFFSPRVFLFFVFFWCVCVFCVKFLLFFSKYFVGFIVCFLFLWPWFFENGFA